MNPGQLASSKLSDLELVFNLSKLRIFEEVSNTVLIPPHR